MPTIRFNCPSCGKPCAAYVDKNTEFNCSKCGKRIKPHPNGKVDIIQESTKSVNIIANQPKSEDTSKQYAHSENLRTTAREVINPETKTTHPQPHTTHSNLSTNQPDINKKHHEESNWQYISSLIFVIIGLFAIIAFVIDFGQKHFKEKPLETNTVTLPQATQPINNTTVPNNNTPEQISVPQEKQQEINIDTVFKSYYGKYTIDENGTPQIDSFKLTAEANQIIYEKDGVVKNFESIYQGSFIREPQQGARFKYHKFFLTNKNIYLIISDRKEVTHESVYYYRIIVDGQTQLAL